MKNSKNRARSRGINSVCSEIFHFNFKCIENILTEKKFLSVTINSSAYFSMVFISKDKMILSVVSSIVDKETYSIYSYFSA